MSENENSDSDIDGVSDFRNPPFIRKYLPDTVQKFLLKFVEVINSSSIPEILQIYEETFPQIIEHYFNKYDWPDVMDVAEVIKNKMFVILYKELYYGQMCQRNVTPPELELRIESFLNYCDFFNSIIATKNPVTMELPEIWLWELMDEFISQFQNYTQYRSRFVDKDSNQINKLCMENQSVWSILCVLNVLHTLINISKIHVQLIAMSEGGDAHAVAGKFGKLSMYKTLGIYALVGLSRIHCILGDYFLSIKVLEPLIAMKSVLDVQLPACQITAIYHVNFSFMMARRYSDAVLGLIEIITAIQRDKHQFSTRTYQAARLEQIIDRMYHLLALCLVLQSKSINESLITDIFDPRFQEGIAHLQTGNLDTFQLYFLAACPDIIVSSPPSVNSPMSDYNKIALDHHLAIFMSEVRYILGVKEIRGWLKPYSTIHIEKMWPLILPKPIINDLGILLSRLLSCKVLNLSKESNSRVGDEYEIILERDLEIDFYIDHSLINIVNTHVGHRYGEYFMSKFSELSEISNKIKSITIQ